MRKLCRFTFPDGTDGDFIEAQVAWAIFNAECTFGKPRVRLSASYDVSEDRRECVIDVDTEVGEHIAQVLAGFLTHHLGEDSFRVERILANTPQEAAIETGESRNVRTR